MNEPLKSLDEIKRLMDEKDKAEQEHESLETEQNNAVLAVENECKAITEISANDIKLKIDESKSMEQQAEDVVGAMATAKAVQDEETAKALTDKKAEELLAKAEAKKKEAKTAETKAEVKLQEANRSKNEAVLQTFGINKHLPDWLLKIMVVLFAPIYIVLSFIIGVPCGVIKFLIDDIDNILVTYENAEAQGKRKIKVTVWIAFISMLVVAIGYIVLKATKSI